MNAFMFGFMDEFEKKGFTLLDLLLSLGVTGTLALGGATGGVPGAITTPLGFAAGGRVGVDVAVGMEHRRHVAGRPAGIAPTLAGLGITLAGTAGGAALGRKISQWLTGRKKDKKGVR